MGITTKEKLAELINGRDYGKEIDKYEEALAKESGLVVVFGASDDLCELRGAINDEVSSWEGGTMFLNEKGTIQNLYCPCDDCRESHKKRTMESKRIEINRDDEGYSWTYDTEIPHATFDIMEDGEKYCRGIIFHIDDLKEKKEATLNIEVKGMPEVAKVLSFAYEAAEKFIKKVEDGHAKSTETFNDMKILKTMIDDLGS